ncbi:MAG: HDOD domain-containing protein, partial [Rubrivivax sp.]|nr:HDOD domain-containing protein [Rubrivivax sp.]
MQDHPILGHLAIGYSPLIDRQRAVVSTRLTIFPDRPDAVLDGAALLSALAEVWPDADTAMSLTLRPLGGAGSAAAAAPTAPALLTIAGEALLLSVLAAPPRAQLMVEVPAFMATDPAHAAALQQARAAGMTLVLKGRPMTDPPVEVLRCFSHAIVDPGQERRGDMPTAAGVGPITTIQAGVRTSADLEAAFQRGAVAVLGWPFDDPLASPKGRTAVPPGLQVVMELMNGVDSGLPVDRLEAILKKDPTLAFRLLRYINSPAFGLSVEVGSFGHALMLLGYQRLKRWLALLLVSASQDGNLKPVMFAAVRRGMLMEELMRSSGDAEMRGELFICGVFSLLDRLLQQPFADLLKAVPVPERVQQAL